MVESKITFNCESHFQMFRNFAQLNVVKSRPMRLEGPSVLTTLRLVKCYSLSTTKNNIACRVISQFFESG